MIHDSITSCIGWTPLVHLRRLFPERGLDVLAKLEFLNPGGSIKDRVARFMIEQGLQTGGIPPEAHLIESSSGNLGIALAMVAKTYNLAFTCVLDPKASAANIEILRLLGAHVEIVTQLDQYGSYLHTRICRVKELLETIPDSVWINQYANPLNWQAHYNWCEQEIVPMLDEPVDCLVSAVSTTGTIMGVARCLRRYFPALRVIAVDAVGSVIFGAPPQPREIPGIGSSRVPELLNPNEIDEIVYVNDSEAVRGCRDLIRCEGMFAGGSAGSVVAAIQRLRPTFPQHYCVLTLLPDRGERYLTTIYNDEWASQLL